MSRPDEPVLVFTGADDSWLASRVYPHAEALAPIFDAGGIAVIVHEPDDDNAQVAATLGWPGRESRVFRMSAAGRRGLAQACSETDDQATAEWLSRKHGRRVFVIDGPYWVPLTHTGNGWKPEGGNARHMSLESEVSS